MFRRTMRNGLWIPPRLIAYSSGTTSQTCEEAPVKCALLVCAIRLISFSHACHAHANLFTLHSSRLPVLIDCAEICCCHCCSLCECAAAAAPRFGGRVRAVEACLVPSIIAQTLHITSYHINEVHVGNEECKQAALSFCPEIL